MITNGIIHKSVITIHIFLSGKDEEGYQTLSACGVISNEKSFSIDHERITAINEALWVEE